MGKVSTNSRSEALTVGSGFDSEVFDVCADFLPEALEVGTDSRAKALNVGSKVLTQALEFRPDFGAQSAEVTTRFVQYARISAARVAPMARVAISSTDTVDSERLVCFVAAR